MPVAANISPQGDSAIYENCESATCTLCGERDAYESHYGEEMGLCFYCAEQAANLFWMAHAGEFLTWPNEQRKATRKKPVSHKVRWQVLREHDFTCAECGAQDRPMHVDHINPRAKGGGNEISNLQALCDRCNIRKGAS